MRSNQRVQGAILAFPCLLCVLRVFVFHRKFVFSLEGFPLAGYFAFSNSRRASLLAAALALSPVLLLPGAGCARRSTAAPAGLFEDVAAAAGIRFQHSNGADGRF